MGSHGHRNEPVLLWCLRFVCFLMFLEQDVTIIAFDSHIPVLGLEPETKKTAAFILCFACIFHFKHFQCLSRPDCSLRTAGSASRLFGESRLVLWAGPRGQLASICGLPCISLCLSGAVITPATHHANHSSRVVFLQTSEQKSNPLISDVFASSYTRLGTGLNGKCLYCTAVCRIVTALTALSQRSAKGTGSFTFIAVTHRTGWLQTSTFLIDRVTQR